MGRILVTGAGGFIGSHLVETLVRRGHEVRALFRYNSGGACGWFDEAEPDVRNAVDILHGDIRDADSVRLAVKGCGTVMHLAALIGIPYSYLAPTSYLETNIHGTLNVLQAAREYEVERVVQTSTSEVYGTARFVPITEDHPLQTQSPYAASKSAADQLAISYHHSFGLPVSIIRPFNAYGPRQSARAVIPAIITQVLDGRRRIRLGALHPTRDMNFVTDIVAAFIAVAESGKTIGEVVNAGSNFEISIGRMLELIAEVAGVEVEAEVDPQRLRPEASEVERLWAGNAKILALTGWTPAYGGLDGFRRGLERTVEWFRGQKRQASSQTGRYHV